jgi:serine/threonine protein kinase
MAVQLEFRPHPNPYQKLSCTVRQGSPYCQDSILSLSRYNPRRPHLMALATDARLGPDEILAPLGAGGLGEVYKARDIRLDRTIAIKVLRARVARLALRTLEFLKDDPLDIFGGLGFGT